MVAASFVLFLLPASSALAAVSCDPLERGTLGADGAFTRGTGASNTDYLISCTGDGGDVDEVNWGHFFDSAGAPGADEFPDAARRDPDTRLIVDVDNARLNLGTDQYLPDDAQSRYRIVIEGSIRGDGAGTTGANVWVLERVATDMVVDSHADIRMTAAAQGILVSYGEEVPGGSIRVRNFGHILTEGEGTGVNPWRAHGVNIFARAGDAEFTNEAGASIETRGKGARGATIFSRGSAAFTATAINRGTVTVTGEPILNPDGSVWRAADGVYAGVEGLEGTARAINDSGGTIRAVGGWARGLRALACAWTGQECDPNGRGTALAINRGSVTTTGEQSSGVAAHGDGAGATARVVNEAGGTINTEGLRAFGLQADSDGANGSAEAENRGSVTTTGDRAYAIDVLARRSGASAVNQEGGSIETSGAASRGIHARTRGADKTVSVVNHGSVTTSGNPISTADESDFYIAIGVIAVAEGIRSTAEATNETGGTIRTGGAAARGIQAYACVWTGQECDPNGRGTAIARNRGSVVTTGDAYLHTDGSTRSTGGVVGGADGDGATARAVNEAGGTIRTEGAGATGLHVFVHRNTGSEVGVAENRGEIVTTGSVGVEGRRSIGIESYSSSGGTLAWNRTTGRVHTTGSGAYGVIAGSRGEGSTARAVNEGSIRTEGEDARGLYAWSNQVASGRAEVVNRRSGRVETTGDVNAWGLMAWADGETSSTAAVTNEGTVITRGTNADGVLAVAGNGGTSARPNSAHAINTTGGSIETEGDGSSGLNATVALSGTGRMDSFGTARAENHGTVVTAGGIYYDEVSRGGTIAAGAAGVIASFWPLADETEIGNTGDATVVNTGDVTVTGGAAGLASRTFGIGTTTVEMTGGSVTSGAADEPGTAEDESSFGIGIWAVARTDSTADDPGDDTDVRIAVSGSGTTVTAHGATTDDPATDDWDEGTGIGIFGKTGETGHIEVEVSGGATITADRAAVFDGGRTTFTLDGSTLVGDVEFAGLDDTLTVRNGLIDGDVHFGDGTDTLVLDVPESGGITGRVTGLEEMLKRGAGIAHIFDAEFTGSALEVEDGELSVTGHLDLGNDGTLTVHDPSRLSVVVGDLTEDAGDHGRITAGGGVIYQGLEEDEAPEMFLQLGSDVLDRADAIRTVLEESPIDVLEADTRVKRQTDAGPVDVDETRLSTADPDGSTRAIGSVQVDGEVRLAEGVNLVVDTPAVEPTPVREPRRSGGGRRNPGLMLAGGGALFAALIFDSLDDEETAFADWDEATRERRTLTSFGGIRSGHALEHRLRTGGLEQWTRTFAGDAPIILEGATGTVRGVAMGLDARLGRGFRVGVAAMPEFSLSAPAGPASDYDSRLDGRHLALRGGWSGASLFADAALSRGRHRAHSLFDNPVAGGVLSGESGLAHSRIRGRAGARLGLGPLQATPSLSLFSGSLRQDAHVALSASLRAVVPAISQRYDGWKAGLNLAPAGWLQGPRELRWRPGLHMASTRTRTHGPAIVDLRQSDRAGVLGFSSVARVRALPRTVHSFGASLSAMQSDSWRLRLGYVGLVVDGEPVHAAVARLHVRF